LLNLLGNAIKFTDQGQVSLHVQVLPARGFEARLHFEVCDTGIGISGEHLKNLFQPFEQVGDLKRRAGGTGLGLAISRQLAQLMGGDISVDSKLSEGSVFHFELSAPTADVTPVKPQHQMVAGYRGERKKVLVVDDIVANRMMLADLLQDLGFEILIASNGQEGIAQAQLTKPDLILMDVMMPVMDGLEAISRIRNNQVLKGIVILAVSASTTDSDREQCFAVGANGFISKPIDQSMLLQEIGAHLNLSWVLDDANMNAPSDLDNDSPIVAPPPHEIEALHQLVLAGNLRDIYNWTKHISSLDSEFQPFAQKVHQFAREFDLEAILQFAEKFSSGRMEM
jgi:CheY-like chemotaxis protein